MNELKITNKKTITFSDRVEYCAIIFKHLLNRLDSEEEIAAALWHSKEPLHKINEGRFDWLLGEALEDLGIEDEENERFSISIVECCKKKEPFTHEMKNLFKKMQAKIVVDLYIFKKYGEVIVMN
jgi:hypothetical protein